MPPSGSDGPVFALTPAQTVIVFLIGLVPFGVATIEFWRRIAVGDTFGTGTDAVVFSTSGRVNGKDNDTGSSAPASRGRRVLGRDALAAAYALFAAAAAVLGLVGYAVLTTPVPPAA